MCNISFAQGSDLQVRIVDQKSDRITQGEIRILNDHRKIIVQRSIPSSSLVSFKRLPKKFILEIEAPGFEVFRRNILLKPGLNQLTVELIIEKIKAKVEVERSEAEKRLDRAFSGYLSQEDIDSLPDNPREIEKELKRRYGDDAIITVNGFTGGQIPPKEAIRSIQISRSRFDAEFHYLGRPTVNITTKAFVPKYVGMLMFNYGNSTLNGRNAFSESKLPQGSQVYTGMLIGPLSPKVSFTLFGSQFSNTREETIVASAPSEFDTENQKAKSITRSINGELNYDAGLSQTLRIGYEHSDSSVLNSGVGGLSLLERGISSDTLKNEVKVSLNGTIGKNFTSQFRSRMNFTRGESLSNSQEVGLDVAGTFFAGGSGIDNRLESNGFEVFGMLSGGLGKHFMKFGGEAHIKKNKVFSANAVNGRYFFSSLDNYNARIPSTFYRKEGITEISFTYYDSSLFVQDEFRVARRLQFGFGLRYEVQNLLSDKNNFSPRLSVTYVLDEKARFVLRSGVGILYQWHRPSDFGQILANDGRQSPLLIINNPGFPDPNTGGTLREPLPPSILKQTANLKNPNIYISQTALNMNFDDGLKIDVSYKFEKGVHMFRSRDINAPIDGIRPDLRFGRITQLESSGNFRRNSLSVSGSGVLFKRVRINGRYLLSKATTDYDSIFGLPMDSYNLAIERGNAPNDRRHLITAGFDYSPFRDFRINPSFSIRSPKPYTLTTGFDSNGDSVFNDRPDRVARNTLRGSWDKNVNLNLTWGIPFMKRSVTVNGEKQSNKLPDALKYHKIQLIINVNNLLNNTNRNSYVGNQLSPLFGQPTIAAPARSITFGLMFLYF